MTPGAVVGGWFPCTILVYPGVEYARYLSIYLYDKEYREEPTYVMLIRPSLPTLHLRESS